MNNIKNAVSIFVKNLNPNEVFLIPGIDTEYVCDYKRTEGNKTTVVYHVKGDPAPNGAGSFEFTRANLSTVYMGV